MAAAAAAMVDASSRFVQIECGSSHWRLTKLSPWPRLQRQQRSAMSLMTGKMMKTGSSTTGKNVISRFPQIWIGETKAVKTTAMAKGRCHNSYRASTLSRYDMLAATKAGFSQGEQNLQTKLQERQCSGTDSKMMGLKRNNVVVRSSSSSSSSSSGKDGEVAMAEKPAPIPLSPSSAVHFPSFPRQISRSSIRLALPSKGRMAEDSLGLLRDCQLTVKKPNPRQYIAKIPEMDAVEVWFQRASDVVRKVRSGDVDFGIVGYDMLREYGEDDNDLIIIHDALGFGHCHLAIGVPTYGAFAEIESLDELAAMAQWTSENPLRVVTGYTHVGSKFLNERGMKHVQLSTADGALEAGPAMGTADVILDLVSSGTTLRENNLKEIAGGTVMESQGVLVASRKALLNREGVLDVAHELLERIEAHLRADNQFVVTANVRGSSEDDVAQLLFSGTDFTGLQGPTISRVYNAPPRAPPPSSPSSSQDLLSVDSRDRDSSSYFAICVIVPKCQLYKAIRQLRDVGGSGVLVSPLTYIFDEEPLRWRSLLDELNL